MSLNLNLGLTQSDPWTIRRTLEAGDLGGELYLPKDEMVDIILPEMEDAMVNRIQKRQILIEEVFVGVRDMATNQRSDMRLRQTYGNGAPNYGTFYLAAGWLDFHRSKGLKPGDEFGLCYDRWTGEFKFHVLSFNRLETGEISSSSTRRKTEEVNCNGEGNVNSCSIPHDLLMEVAKEFPVKSLLRFLSVSKLWESTIRSQDFINSYMKKSLIRPPQRQGLVFTFICYGLASGLVVYNPCTRRFIVLPRINTERGRRIINHYIGYDPIGNDYKVLCVTSRRPEMGSERGLAEELRVLTLTRGNEHSWRMFKADDIPPPHSPLSDEICIGGVLYYGAFTGADLAEQGIIRFDVRSEKFGLIKAPVEFLDSSSKLTSYEGKLAVIFLDDQVVLWVLDEYEEWSKMSFNLPSLIGFTTDLDLHLFSGTNAGEIVLAPVFVRASTFRVLYYDPKKGSFRKIEIEGITESNIPHEVVNWWYCRTVSVFPGQVESLLFL